MSDSNEPVVLACSASASLSCYAWPAMRRDSSSTLKSTGLSWRVADPPLLLVAGSTASSSCCNNESSSKYSRLPSSPVMLVLCCRVSSWTFGGRFIGSPSPDVVCGIGRPCSRNRMVCSTSGNILLFSPPHTAVCVVQRIFVATGAPNGLESEHLGFFVRCPLPRHTPGGNP